ncbi:hypothetical protein FisN_17Hh061 [Fistulifera solaris]|uniref:Uncharacterized protein n=1 Tax=Fistulifera solaris TaxID=1519565 RepID=A0A1Z5JGW1_FISSO|nr:hypothetical protein FisN_17Hh061 [Fistulifera solaris]|eukprot:GAX13132.1 hypothetical protein FisN_17Hh061 [Fistulifera solaris]
MRHSLLSVLLLATCTQYTLATVRDASALPGSLRNVLTALEKDHSQVAAACLLTSTSVTPRQTDALLTALTGSAAKVVGTASGNIVAAPESIPEATLAACACDGTIVYYASAVDLLRGEGLFRTLAPALESLVAVGATQGKLMVIVPQGLPVAETQALLEAAAEEILSHLVTPSVTNLQGIFSQITYIPWNEVNSSQMEHIDKVPTTQMVSRLQAAAHISDIRDLSSVDVTAVRLLAPAARLNLKQAMEQVRSITTADDGTTQLVANFGQVCEAALEQAQSRLVKAAGSSAAALLASPAGRQCQIYLETGVERELYGLFEEQMSLCGQASFEQLKKSLSKLIVAPTLADDMEREANKAIAAFSAAAKKMVCKKCSSWSVDPAKDEFRRVVKDYIAKRLLSARAGGQFRPVPRKGITVGLHWLLPKPFGNDYRQEPWMVHATDGLVYVPKDKITDVSPEEVAAGDWRRKVVPSPVGNDMVYMQ